MTISKSQRTALLWIANNSVTLDTLPKRGHGRLLQNTKNLLRGGLVDAEVGGLLRPTPAGWKALCSAAIRAVEAAAVAAGIVRGRSHLEEE